MKMILKIIKENPNKWNPETNHYFGYATISATTVLASGGDKELQWALWEVECQNYNHSQQEYAEYFYVSRYPGLAPALYEVAEALPIVVLQIIAAQYIRNMVYAQQELPVEDDDATDEYLLGESTLKKLSASELDFDD